MNVVPSNGELEELLLELSSRTRVSTRARVKRWLWGVTVRNSYRLKRLLDIVVSLTALLFLSPVFMLIALAVKLTSRGPLVFSQVRVGRYGRHFRFYKFRSM